MEAESSADPQSKLYFYKWPGKGVDESNEPKGVILIFHGQGSHLGRYGHIASMFAEQGYDVVGYDSHGFGKSDGERGVINNIDNYFEDAKTFTFYIREHYFSMYVEKHLMKMKDPRKEKEARAIKFPFIAFGYSLGAMTVIGSFEKGRYGQNPFFDFIIMAAPGFRSALTEDERNEITSQAKDSPSEYYVFQNSVPFNEDISYLS